MARGRVVVAHRGGDLVALDLAGTICWSTHLADAWILSSPTIVDGVVYVISEDGIIRAVDLADGRIRWPQPTHTSGAHTSVAAADGLVYAVDGNGTLHALQATTGQPRWRAEVEADHDLGSGPAVRDGRVVVASHSGQVLALEATTGRLLWANHGPTAGASPAIDALTLYAADRVGIRAIAASDGRLRWRWDWPAPGNSGSPTVTANAVLASGTRRTLQALDKTTGRKLWFHPLDGAPGTTTATDGYILVTVGNKMWAFR